MEAIQKLKTIIFDNECNVKEKMSRALSFSKLVQLLQRNLHGLGSIGLQISLKELQLPRSVSDDGRSAHCRMSSGRRLAWLFENDKPLENETGED